MILKNELLGHLPAQLRDELFAAYGEVLRNFRERRWEPSELNGGKLCEVVYSIVKGHLSGTFPKKSQKPKNMVDACKALEQESSTFPRSLRIQIPRMLQALYEIRNNRGVGHVGGDVNPNHMDATCVVAMSQWLIGELVRVFHDVSTDEATSAVDALVERTHPTVWKVGNQFRVLDSDMSMKDKALSLLYHCSGPINERQLFEWVEYSNPSTFRRDVLRPTHKAKLLEYNEEQKTVELSPKGIAYVEELLLTR